MVILNSRTEYFFYLNVCAYNNKNLERRKNVHSEMFTHNESSQKLLLLQVLDSCALAFLVYALYSVTFVGTAELKLSAANLHGRTSASSSCEGGEAFGALLGAAHNVAAFSNCNSDTIADVYNGIVWQWNGALGKSQAVARPYSTSDVRTTTSELGTSSVIYTGMKWQCVEYARRFLIETRNVTFGDVDGAADMWTSGDVVVFSHVISAENSSLVPSHRRSHGTHGRPKAGDLIIWDRQHGMPYGHVAVVVAGPAQPHGSPNDSVVYVAEQNFASHRWGKNFSRVLELPPHTSDETTPWRDAEGFLIAGWIEIE